MKKTILIILIFIGTLNAQNYTSKTIRMADYNSHLKSIDFLVKNNNKITEIIQIMEILQKNMKGFEERKIVIALLKEFSDKYDLSKTDLIPLRINLNKILKIKNKNKE